MLQERIQSFQVKFKATKWEEKRKKLLYVISLSVKKRKGKVKGSERLLTKIIISYRFGLICPNPKMQLS